MREEVCVLFFKVTKILPQSTWRLDSVGGNKANKVPKSMYAFARICALILFATGGGSEVTAFGGAGCGVPEKREKGDRVCREVLGRGAGAAAICGGIHTQKTAPRTGERAKQGEEVRTGRGRNDNGACANSGSIIMLG